MSPVLDQRLSQTLFWGIILSRYNNPLWEKQKEILQTVTMRGYEEYKANVFYLYVIQSTGFSQPCSPTILANCSALSCIPQGRSPPCLKSGSVWLHFHAPFSGTTYTNGAVKITVGSWNNIPGGAYTSESSSRAPLGLLSVISRSPRRKDLGGRKRVPKAPLFSSELHQDSHSCLPSNPPTFPPSLVSFLPPPVSEPSYCGRNPIFFPLIVLDGLLREEHHHFACQECHHCTSAAGLFMAACG